MIGRADPLDNSRLDSAARDWSADAALPMNARLVRTSRAGTASGSGLRTRRGRPRMPLKDVTYCLFRGFAVILPVCYVPGNDFLAPTDRLLVPMDGLLDPADDPLDPVDDPLDPADGPLDPADGPLDPTSGSAVPTDDRLAPTDGSLVSADGSLVSADGSLVSTDGSSSPTWAAAAWPVNARLVRTSRVGTASGSGLRTRRGPRRRRRSMRNECGKNAR